MSKKGDKPAYSFETYLATVDPVYHQGLAELRSIILSVVPQAEEVFSYQVHCFKHIYMLVGIGVTQKYCSLYTMSSKLVKSIKPELEGYRMSGMTLHFDPLQPIPADIVTRIVQLRMQENELIALGKKK